MPKLPANNRMHSSSALQTHGVWSNVIGYDPYAPEKKGAEPAVGPSTNAYENYQGLLALARLTGGNNISQRGTCKRCGGVGHLTFQCRNFLKNTPNLNANEISSTSSESEDNNNGDANDSGPEDILKEKPKKDSVYREEKEDDTKIIVKVLLEKKEHHSKRARSPANDKGKYHKKHHKKDKTKKRK